MSGGLRISAELALPVEVAGEAIAMLAKRGAGKTNTATVLVEELDAHGVQVVVLDPVGAWWGLRSSADGKSGGLSIAILGGQHGDVPLAPEAGQLIADVVVDSGKSLVLDLSDFPSKAAVGRFVADFAERLFRRKARASSLLHVVLEEADLFAPQRVTGDAARMQGAIEQIVRRGRSRGIGMTMITQRSAVLSKDILTQADVLVVMRTTGPHDQAAVKAWIDAHDDDQADVVNSLASLATGEAWVWNPERGVLRRVMIRRRRTFDSSSTPKAGERRVDPKAAAEIDLQALGAEIQATAERAKENDPAELRKKLREAESKLAATRLQVRGLEEELAAPRAPAERVEVSAISRLHLKPIFAYLDESRAAAEEGLRELGILAEEIDMLAPRSSEPAAAIGSEFPAGLREESSQTVSRPVAAPGRPPARPTPPAAEIEGLGVSGPQRRILNALAALEQIGIDQAAKVQLALFAEASPKSSSYSNNLGALRTSGLIDYPTGGRVQLTDSGRMLADAGAAPATVDELHGYVYGLVGGAKSRLLQVLIEAYPEPRSKNELAFAAGSSATSSSFSNNLGALRSLGLIDYPQPGLIAALPVLFMEAAS